jgi:hypothetical protein
MRPVDRGPPERNLSSSYISVIRLPRCAKCSKPRATPRRIFDRASEANDIARALPTPKAVPNRAPSGRAKRTELKMLRLLSGDPKLLSVNTTQ